jgi:exo-beta-1,3-glucanase (GH17 family)
MRRGPSYGAGRGPRNPGATRSRIRPGLCVLLALTALTTHAVAAGDVAPSPHSVGGSRYARQSPFVVRPLRPYLGQRWIGEAIAYGPHRDGQRPGGPSPTMAEVAEDLRLMSHHWNLIRTYQSVGPADSILEAIRSEALDIRVMLGVWIEPEEARDSTGNVVEPRPAAAAANRAEIDSAVRLAAAYPDIVVALCVGNETQIYWSSHRVPASLLTGAIREMRARTSLPVTTADDFNFWNKPESLGLAQEVDFIVTHMHPLWNGLQPEAAADWTAKTYDEVRRLHAGRAVVIGETGWATGKLQTGEQGTLMKGPVGEEEQAVFCNSFAAWARRERVTTFFFEAFDENWKGGADPDDAEKHWGFYRADRTPKRVLLVHE